MEPIFGAPTVLDVKTADDPEDAATSLDEKQLDSSKVTYIETTSPSDPKPISRILSA